MNNSCKPPTAKKLQGGFLVLCPGGKICVDKGVHDKK